MTHLAFFTRVLDEAAPAARYRLAIEQIRHAEALGYDSAWVAQHHFDGAEGGLPAPLVFLAAAAQATDTIRIGTGIITIAMEEPVRLAEDAAVLDALSGGRLELGFGSGGTPTAFPAFGADFADRHAHFDDRLAIFDAALAGRGVRGTDRAIYPPAGDLVDRTWFATFTSPLAERAGREGRGLMLSRTQPRPKDAPLTSLADVQHEVVDAYESALAPGAERRVSIARSVVVTDADYESEARQLAAARYRASGFSRMLLGDAVDTLDDDELLARTDAHVGTVSRIVDELGADTVLPRATHLSFQVHTIDPPHARILRSIELLVAEVAPRLGWRTSPVATEVVA